MNQSLPITIAAVAMLLTGVSCSSSQVSLEYLPPDLPPGLKRGPAIVGVGPFEDRRGESEFFLGSIKSPVGAPIEYIETRIPVARMVANAFGHGLNSRRMLASANSQRFVIRGRILSLYCDHLARPHAEAKMIIQLVDTRNGRPVYSEIHEAERTLDPRTPSRDSRALLASLSSAVVGEIVDRALDDRALRSALR